VGSELGVPTEKIDALPDYGTSPWYDEAERVALEYADAMTLTGREVTDELVHACPPSLRRGRARRADRDRRLGERVGEVQPRAADPLPRSLETGSDPTILTILKA
jgi:hypothetical protein